MRKRSIVAAATLALGVAGVTGAAVASGNDDETGSHDYTRQQATDATEAALRITHGGHANSVERDSEDGAVWEVEVTRPDSSTVDVRLDADLELVVVDGDDDRSG